MQVETITKCRICLFIAKSKQLIDWNSLVEECFEEIKTYRDCFQFCTGLATTESEELPKMLCHTCATELKEVYKFIRKARKSNEELLALEKSRKDFVFEEFTAWEDFDQCKAEEPEEESLNESLNEESSPENNAVSECSSEKSEVGEIEYLEEDIPSDEEGSKTEVLWESSKETSSAAEKQAPASLTSQTTDITQSEDIDYWDAFAAEELYESSKEECDADDYRTEIADSTTDAEHSMCEYCNKKFPTTQLNRHIQRDHKRNCVLCHLCPRTFKIQSELEKHLNTHKEKREPEYTCEICGRKLLTKKTYTYHVKSHKLKYEFACDQCDKSFKHKYDLKLHKFVHNERNIPCPLCQKCWRSESALKSHLRTHRGEKPFVCPECGKKYTTKLYLENHLRIHKGIMYKCDICFKEYRYRTTFSTHRQKHWGKPLRCTICQAEYGSRNKIQQHIIDDHQVENEEVHKFIEKIPLQVSR